VSSKPPLRGATSQAWLGPPSLLETSWDLRLPDVTQAPPNSLAQGRKFIGGTTACARPPARDRARGVSARLRHRPRLRRSRTGLGSPPSRELPEKRRPFGSA